MAKQICTSRESLEIDGENFQILVLILSILISWFSNLDFDIRKPSQFSI